MSGDGKHEPAPQFKIAAAQVVSQRGDISGNIETHAAAIKSAAERRISVLIFPELSLIGYELDLAAELAMTPADERLSSPQELARRLGISVVCGAPLRNVDAKPSLGSILFGADGSIRTYCKMHLGGSEPTYFTPGNEPLAFETDGQKVGLAICADSSEPSHPQGYVDDGSTIYASSVFLHSEWYEADTPRLADYASRLGILVVMANQAASVGTTAPSIGQSTIWSPGGDVLVEATNHKSSLVIATRTGETWCGEVVPL